MPVLIDTQISECSDWKQFVELVNSQKTSKQKGDLFERLTQVYLQTAPIYRSKIKDVWWCNNDELPIKIRKKLNLPNDDEGIDLLCETFEGEFWSVQSKYRSNSDRALTTKELSKFTSLSFVTAKNISQGLVVHTSTKKVRKSHLMGNTFEIGLQHWLDISENHWRQIIDVCNGNALQPPEKRDPREHQTIAIEKAVAHFVENKSQRGKLIMPCGTGKSLTAYWITKALNVKSVILAVPSIALVKQSLDDWSSESLAEGVRPNWLAVCSDDSVGSLRDADSTVATVYEAGIPTTTKADVIINFINAKSDTTNIIFTTYHSSPKLAAVCKSGNTQIDLLIADEAHKTVGRKDKAFATLLSDDHIKIKKRLFMTATERVYRQGSDNVVSMDDESVYGKTFHQMSFKKAIDDGIICDYKILTVCVGAKEVESLIAENTPINARLGNLSIDAEANYLAAGIAVRKVFEKHNIKHAVSFHRSIKKAEEFAEQQEIIGRQLSGGKAIISSSISSKLSAGQRSQLLKDFATEQRSLITNARCLTEGVDIPAIDCVAFIDPKQSVVDIVQAAGRAMRQSKKTGKKHGYILLPILVPDGCNLSEFAETTNFRVITRIVTALSTQDERIAEELRNNEVGQHPDRDRIIDIDSDIIEAVNIDYQTVYDSITTNIWESVGRANWRPFDEARDFVHSLNLLGQTAWFEYAKSTSKPPDIPASPNRVYPQWRSWGHWLGTNTIATSKRIYRPFDEAKRFVHSLNLNSYNPDWIDYSKGAFKQLPSLPGDIPSNPQRTYKTEWKNWGDWLGTGRKATHLRQYRPFEEAREFVKTLGLKSEKGGRIKRPDTLSWRNFRSGGLVETLGVLPLDIPSNPSKVYDQFTNWPDFLGTNHAPRDLEYWNYEKAREWVLKLKLHERKIIRAPETRKNSARNKWCDFCAGLYSDLPVKPQEIPASIHHQYKDKGYQGYKHFITL